MSKWTESRKVNIHYTLTTHKNHGLQHQKSKVFETKIYKGVDGVHKFTTNPYKPFRSQKRVLRYTICQEAM